MSEKIKLVDEWEKGNGSGRVQKIGSIGCMTSASIDNGLDPLRHRRNQLCNIIFGNGIPSIPKRRFHISFGSWPFREPIKIVFHPSRDLFDGV